MSYSTSSEINLKKSFSRATYLVLNLLVALSLSFFSLTSAPPVAKKRKKYSVFIYSEAEPDAMYAIYEHMRNFCVLQL